MRNNTKTITPASNLPDLAELNLDDGSACTDTTQLSTIEQRMLEHHETIINQGKNAVWEVGRSLLTIQRLRLYRKDYASFNEYCRNRWGFGRQRGYELVNAAVVSEQLQSVGVQIDNLNERQLRSVTRLKDADQRVTVMARAQELASGRKMTSRHVEEAVDEQLGIKKGTVIDVDPELPQGTCTVVANQRQVVTKADVEKAFEGLRDIAQTLKVQQYIDQPLQQLAMLIEEYLEGKSAVEEDFAGTTLAA